jgi:hypothetical protein
MNTQLGESSFNKSMYYRIKVEGLLHDSIIGRFDDYKIQIERGENDQFETTISGKFPDQGALTGVLNYLYNLHLTVLSVTRPDIQDLKT